jgi:hypothetical protein
LTFRLDTAIDKKAKQQQVEVKNDTSNFVTTRGSNHEIRGISF